MSNDADIRKKMWDGFKPVLVFFGWTGFAIGGGYLFDRGMPPGFGNVIFLCQIAGGVISAGFLSMGVPSALDPSTIVVVSGARGGPNRFSTRSRKTALKLVYVGLAVFVSCNAGGYVIDRAIGVPSRHTSTARIDVAVWVKTSPPPAFTACLARVSPHEVANCSVWFDTRTETNGITVTPSSTACHNAPIARCVQNELHGFVSTRKPETLETLRYAWGSTQLEISGLQFAGTGPAPPAERE